LLIFHLDTLTGGGLFFAFIRLALGLWSFSTHLIE
jgi:hypothetical protein